MRQRALARVSNKLPLFASCIVFEAFSLPTRGFGHRAQHLGARLGSLDRRRRTLPGQRGRIDNSTVTQENSGGRKTHRCVVSCLCVCLQLSMCGGVPALSLVSVLLFSGVSVNRRMVVGAIDESQPGLHWGGLWRPYNKWASVTRARPGETLL